MSREEPKKTEMFEVAGHRLRYNGRANYSAPLQYHMVCERCGRNIKKVGKLWENDPVMPDLYLDFQCDKEGDVLPCTGKKPS